MFIFNLNIYKQLILLSVISLVLVGCLGKGNIPKPQTGDFNGEVVDTDTGEPIIGVAITGAGFPPVKTDNQGKFSIAVLPPGEYDFSMKQGWYLDNVFHLTHVGKKDVIQFRLKYKGQLRGTILYSGNRDGNWDIYQLDLSERTSVNLTNTPDGETNPVKLFSGGYIFQSSRNNNNDDLFYSNNINERISCCSPDCNDEHPSVDGTGSQMVFKTGERVGNDEKKIIRIYKKDNSLIDIKDNDKNITGYNPVINPSGTMVAIVSGDYKRLLIYSISGSLTMKVNEIDFYTTLNMKINNPCWNPNLIFGEYIAFEAYSESDGPRSIYQIKINAANAIDWKHITFTHRYNEQHKHPCWSKDGSMIFFSGNIAYSSRDDIYGLQVFDNSAQQETAPLIMVSTGSGSKNYPSWGE